MRKICRAIGAATLALAVPAGAVAAEPYDIHVVLPLTGGAAFVGQGEKDALDALETYVDKDGGIAGRPLHFVFHDDQTSPQIAVQLTNGILANQPAVVMGSSLVAMCLAMGPLMKEGPVHYCLSPGVHPKPGGYMFSTSASSTDQIAAVIRYYRLNGWTKLATLMTTDASGQDGDRSIDAVLAYPENKSITKVIAEHFNPSDVSVAAQIARIKESGAQAIVAWTTGAPAATVLRGMIQDGLDIPVAPTSGNQTFAAMHQWKSFLPKHLVLASALYPPHDGVLTLDPRVEKAQHEMYAVLQAAWSQARQYGGDVVGRRPDRRRRPAETWRQRDGRPVARLHRQPDRFPGYRRRVRLQEISRARAWSRRVDGHRLRSQDGRVDLAVEAGRRAAEMRRSPVSCPSP